ncbi:MAG: hypothetical protein ACI8X5_002547 [Planctomycetota bacterium]|jgi:uncharacterized protein YecE (DUF72 family)
MIRVGPAGWSYPDWEGIVYPKPKPRGFHGLAFLAKHFSCIEVNSSFYAMPNPLHAERWVELVDDYPDFRFLSKLNGSFTHESVMDGEEFQRAVGAFQLGIRPLQDSGKLGAILIQFPVSFSATPAGAERLLRLFDAFEANTLALELRHSSWFVEEHYELLRKREVSLLHIDLPSAAEHPPEDVPVTGRIGYQRLHGRNKDTWFQADVGRDRRYDYLYGAAELEEIVRTTKRLEAQSEDVYVITNNHFEGKAIANGLEIQAALQSAPVLAPAELIARYPHLQGIAKSVGQQRLF